MGTLKYAGNGASKVMLTDVKGLIVLDRGTITTLVNAKTLAGWQAHINPATPAEIKATYLDLARGFEPKTTAPEFTTANTGLKEKTKDFPPEFTGYGFMSWEDYRTWFEADGKQYDFIPVLANGDLMHAFDSSGNVIGFEGRMFLTFDLPKPGGDGKQKACAFDIMFEDADVFKKYQITKTAFGRRDIEESVPVGINLEVITPYAVGGAVVVKATQRASGNAYSGLTNANQWTVVGLTSDAAGSITAVDAAQAAIGIYTLTVLNTAADLTGDFEIQANTIAASHVTYLSNVLNVPV